MNVIHEQHDFETLNLLVLNHFRDISRRLNQNRKVKERKRKNSVRHTNGWFYESTKNIFSAVLQHEFEIVSLNLKRNNGNSLQNKHAFEFSRAGRVTHKDLNFFQLSSR